MCLFTIGTTSAEHDAVGEAHKVVELNGDSFCGPFFGTDMPCNQWVASDPMGDPTGKRPGEVRYTLGFHLFESEKDAQLYLKNEIPRLTPYDSRWNGSYRSTKDLRVVKVKYRGILAKGTTFISSSDIQCMDTFAPTIVVSDIFVSSPKQDA